MADFSTRQFAVLVLCVITTVNGFLEALHTQIPAMWENGVDPGQPLFLTPYVEQGKIKEAREVSKIDSLVGIPLTSYAGFLTVNEQYNSNMYFWFFPAQENPSEAPVLLWLQGGPGSSSLFGLFVENGPYTVLENGTLTLKNITWNKRYSMLYIDNPVGTGFSFTRSEEGYARTETDVAANLYNALIQFFQIFTDYQTNDFYVTGESYGGKYVPAISYAIHTNNPSAQIKINFKGMAIGDGLCDPETMMDKYASFMYSIGTLDENQRDYFQQQTDIVVNLIKDKDFTAAFQVFNELLLGGGYYQNVTGSTDYYNFLRLQSPAAMEYYVQLLADPAVRKTIHVGNLTYNDGRKVQEYLTNDFMQSVKPWIAELMDNYKVMIYNGQLDIIIAVPLTESWLQTVQWSGLDEYKKAPRGIWRVNDDIAGYYRQVKNFYQIIVLGSGHILPYDQPARGYDMIQRFVESSGFS